MKSKLKNSHYKKAILSLVFLSILLAFSTLKIIPVFAGIFFGAGLLRLNIEYFYKLLLSFCVFFATNTMIGGVFFALKLPFLITPIIILYLMILGVLFIKYPVNFSYPSLKDISSFTIKILLSIGAFGLIVAPVLSPDHSKAFAIFSFSSDNLSHIELLKAVEDNHGYFYRPFKESAEVITEGLSGYPQGLHINMYFFTEALRPLVDLSGNSYRLVVFIYSFGAAILITLGWMFILAVKRFNRLSFIATLPGIAIGVSLFSGLLFGLFALGSHSQVASMLLFVAMLAFFYYALESTGVKRNVFSLLALLMLGSITFTWLLLLPVAGLTALFFMYLLYLKSPSKDIWSYILPVVSAVTIFCITLIQVYVQINYSSPKSHGVNEQGFSITPSLYLVAAVILTALVVLLLYKKYLKFWLAPLIATSGFALVIYLYQLFTVGEPRYYLYKSLYVVVVVVCAIIVCLGLGELVQERTARFSIVSRLLVTFFIILIVFLPGLYNITNPKDYFVQRNAGGFSREIAEVTLSHLDENMRSGAHIVTVGSCNRGQDYIASRLIGVLSENNNTKIQALLSSLLLHNKEALVRAIEKYEAQRGTKDLTIISSDYRLQAYLQESLKDGVDEEKFIDLDFGHKPKQLSVCPEMVK